MTMTAREAMQALLEGETVYCRKGKGIDRLKLSDDGTLDWCTPDNGWERVPWILNSMEGIYDEYPLVFKEALRAMIDGKTVESENSQRKYFLAGAEVEVFAEMKEGTPGRIFVTEIRLSEQVGKWKVVE